MTKMDDETISSWSEAELIIQVSHQLRQPVSALRDLAMSLVDGDIGFSHEEQKRIIYTIQKDVHRIVKANRYLQLWVSARHHDDE